MSEPPAIARWHEFMAAPEPEKLKAMLAENVVFQSPAVHTPQAGREKTFAYLWAAAQVLGPTLTYQRQWYGDDDAVLRFTAEVDGLQVEGVDIITWGNAGDSAGLITEFTVMARPFKGLQALITAMGKQLAADAPQTHV